jgi:hypothetical protein
MDQLQTKLQAAQRELQAATTELDQHNAQRKVEWIQFCMTVYQQRGYFG